MFFGQLDLSCTDDLLVLVDYTEDLLLQLDWFHNNSKLQQINVSKRGQQ